MPKNPIEYLPLEATLEHLPTIARWMFAEWGADSEGGNEPETLEWLVEISASGFETGFVAVDGINPAGVALLRVNDMDERQDLQPWLSSVIVDDPYRRQGIATELLRRIDELVRERGIPRYYLFTNSAEAM